MLRVLLKVGLHLTIQTLWYLDCRFLAIQFASPSNISNSMTVNLKTMWVFDQEVGSHEERSNKIGQRH